MSTNERRHERYLSAIWAHNKRNWATLIHWYNERKWALKLRHKICVWEMSKIRNLSAVLAHNNPNWAMWLHSNCGGGNFATCWAQLSATITLKGREREREKAYFFYKKPTKILGLNFLKFIGTILPYLILRENQFSIWITIYFYLLI